ncbi:MAG: hypothetical protein CRN43_16695, partial [Candidatus Nephrothrix sp. EaCA]
PPPPPPLGSNLSSYSSYGEEELLQAIRADDQAAFKELFKRYWRKVHSMAYARLRSNEVTEEIVQDIFLSVWLKRHSLAVNNLPAYFFNAVKYKALNHLEAKVVQRKYWDYYKNFIPQAQCATEEEVLSNDLKEAFAKKIEQLPEKSKLIFRLTYIEGKSIAEIAEFLNLSEKAIRYHLTKSSNQLKLYLKNLMLILAIAMIIMIIG